MRTRMWYIGKLRGIKTTESIQTQLDTSMDLLRLGRSDDLRVRDDVPRLMLQLNMDQEAYDFIKSWATCGDRSDDEWGDMDEPYLDIKHADVFEGVELFCSKWDLGHQVTITLLKIKLLIGLKMLQKSKVATVLREKAPREILDCIQFYLVPSPIIAGNLKIMAREDHTAAIKILEANLDDLFKAVHEHNTYFWSSLLHPGPHLAARPQYYSRGTKSQMQIILQSIYDAWSATPGALDWVKDKVANSNMEMFK
jgi:hypothetical protein